jgi:Ca2+-transporting ATPase
MGGATNICSDKTGTLTENRMTVTHVWLGRKMVQPIPTSRCRGCNWGSPRLIYLFPRVQYGNTLPTKDDLASEVHTALVDGISINSTAYITKNKEKNTVLSPFPPPFKVMRRVDVPSCAALLTQFASPPPSPQPC